MRNHCQRSPRYDSDRNTRVWILTVAVEYCHPRRTDIVLTTSSTLGKRSEIWDRRLEALVCVEKDSGTDRWESGGHSIHPVTIVHSILQQHFCSCHHSPPFGNILFYRQTLHFCHVMFCPLSGNPTSLPTFVYPPSSHTLKNVTHDLEINSRRTAAYHIK